jgi:2-iminobutanoate/2-iminopropanoate deaminase
MKFIHAPDAPPASGPYSQAVRSGGFVFCAGQIPVCPTEKKVITHDIESQTAQVFENIRAVLKAAGLTLESVVKTTVFLQDLEHFQRMNRVYEEEFGSHKPARSTVQVSRLPLDVLVEIECIARAK